MSANDPQNPPPNLHLTPVGFSPTSPSKSGRTLIRTPKPPGQFSMAIPLALVLLTLIFTTGRDMVALNKRMTAINEENAPVLEIVKKGSKSEQLEFVDSLKAGVMKLAPTDPIAAQIAREFFPPKSPTPEPDDAPAKDVAPPAADK